MLDGLTTFGVGGPPDKYAEPNSLKEVADVLSSGQQVHVLGEGSNLLVADAGVRGIVLRLGPAFAWLEPLKAGRLWCGAGLALRRLDVDGFLGIPGTLGGAIMGNAGTRTACIGDMVERVWTFGPEGVRMRSREECGFAYRESNLDGAVILGAVIRPGQTKPPERGRQPRGRTAGCVFKNPPGEAAGSLLDKAGLKGFQIGGARVSNEHANFIEALPGAMARDIHALMQEMLRRVLKCFGVRLEPEIRLWGFDQ